MLFCPQIIIIDWFNNLLNLVLIRTQLFCLMCLFFISLISKEIDRDMCDSTIRVSYTFIDGFVSWNLKKKINSSCNSYTKENKYVFFFFLVILFSKSSQKFASEYTKNSLFSNIAKSLLYRLWSIGYPFILSKCGYSTRKLNVLSTIPHIK